MGSLQGVVHVLNGMRDGYLQRDLSQLLHEQVAVLSVHDGFNRSAQHLYAILLQYTRLVQFCTTVQRCLTTKSQQDAVGALLLDNLRHEMRGDRLEVHLISNTFRSLDGCDVWVYQHRGDALLAQCLQRLRARVVKLACLSDFQGTRAEHEHLLQFLLHIVDVKFDCILIGKGTKKIGDTQASPI